MILGLAACANPASDDSGPARTPVTDGVFVTTGIGKSVTTPITVSTTFANNTLIDISIGGNGETGPILDSVKTLLIPRIVQQQSIGVDAIAGATLSSGGVIAAVAGAIDEAGGKSDEWYVAPPRSGKLVKLTGYDVVVVGLGGAGMTAYLKAAEAGVKVYGIEAGGKIGGNSATAGGPMAINSEYIKTLYTGGEDYVNRDALLKEWYADMEADVPADEIPAITSQTVNGVPYPVPAVTVKTPVYKDGQNKGGPKWQIIKQLIDASGETVSWLARDYSFHFARPSGLGYSQYNIVTNYGSENWNPGGMSEYGPVPPGYDSDDTEDLFKTTVFTRAIENAKARNPANGYKLELRATGLIKSGDSVAGVKAAYRDGTAYEIYGKTVILATGGFIGNSAMKNQYFGSDLREEAVHTDRGDGITMAVNDAGAGTYNIDMPAMVHIAQVKNIIQRQIAPTPAEDTAQKVILTNLLLKGDSLVVGLKEGQAGDLRGKRFSNEGSAMMGGIAFENWKTGGYFAAIYSNDVLEAYKTAGMPFAATVMFLGQGMYTPGAPIPNLDEILEAGRQYGNVVRTDTLEGLANALEIGDKADVLKATIEQYNTYVRKEATDPDYDKSNVFDFGTFTMIDFFATQIDPESTSGYTAILGAGYYYGTCGGLDIDGDMQVLKEGSKEKIPGLYAVGQDSMGVLFNAKKAYVGYGAAAQGWAITSGRLAGANASAAAQPAQ
jgi:uncharacterized protein with FMN-binding domain